MRNSALNNPAISRRQFVGATAGMAAGLLYSQGLLSSARGEESKNNRPLIGCIGVGGQGLHIGHRAKGYGDIVAVCDVQLQHAERARADLGGKAEIFEDYRKLLERKEIEAVTIATPDHWHTATAIAALQAGKHVYCEQPVAVDAAGVVRVAAAAARSRAAGLAVVSGFCFRRDDRMVEIVSRLHDGAIGMPRRVQAHAASGLPWRKPAESGRAAGEWPLRNWISFTRYSGGHFVTHHVQAIDRAAWILGDVPPLTAEGMAGSSCPASGTHDTGATGAIGDCPVLTAVRYTYADGRTIEASVDRRERTGDRTVEIVTGSAGSCDLVRGTIAGRRGSSAVPPPGSGRFSAAMTSRVGGILSGRVANDGDTMCRSTLMAVMGRMAAYTGQEITWEQALNSQQQLVPDHLDWDTKIELTPPPQPGVTKFF